MSENLAAGSLPDADFIHRLVPLSEDEATDWAVDLSALPPAGSPVMHRHVIEVSPETEETLRAEATKLGISVEDLIVVRIQNAA